MVLSLGGAKYVPSRAVRLMQKHPVVREFFKTWLALGRQFRQFKDYHHFEKP